MPLIHAHVLSGRTHEQKAAFARAVTEAASKHLGAPATSVRVIIHEIAPGEWFTAGEPKGPPSSTG